MKITDLPELYQDLVLNKIFNGDTSSFNREDLNLMFALHNNFVNPSKKESSRGCGSCVKRVYNKIKESLQDSYNEYIDEKSNIDDIIL